MAIEPFVQKIGVRAGRQVINADLPVSRDGMGDNIGRLGEQLLRTAEPILAKARDREAAADVGKIGFVKNAEGKFEHPGPAPSGGTRYAETYKKIMDDRYVEIVGREEEMRLNDIVGEAEKQNLAPQEVATRLSARAVGVIEAAPPELRLAIEAVLFREVAQRQGSYQAGKIRKDAQVAIQGLEDSFNTNSTVAAELAAKAVTPEQRAEADAHRLKAMAALTRLQEVGAMNQDSVDAGLLKMNINLRDAAEIGVSLENSQAILGSVQGLSLADKRILQNWSLDLDQEKKLSNGKTYGEFRTALPNESIRRRTGSIVANLVSQEDQVIAQAAAEAAANARVQQQAVLIGNSVAQASQELKPHDQKTREALDEQWRSQLPPGMSLPQAMRLPDVQGNLVAMLQTHRHLPEAVRQWMTNGMTGGDAQTVVGFTQVLRQTYSKSGYLIGQQIVNQLPKETQVLIDRVETYGRAGVNPTVAVQRLAKYIQNGSAGFDMAKIRATVVDKEGRPNFDALRDRVIRDYTKATNPALAEVLIKDFDTLFQENYAIDQDVNRALNATGRQLSNGWGGAMFMMGGVAPKIWAHREMRLSDLDKALGLTNNFSFANRPGTGKPYARLEIVDDGVITSQAGDRLFGVYRVRRFKADGTEVPGRVVNMDDVLSDYAKRRPKAAAAPAPKTRAQQIDQAKQNRTQRAAPARRQAEKVKRNPLAKPAGGY